MPAVTLRILPRRLHAAVLALLVMLGSGCSLKTIALKTVANTLSEPGDAFTSDDDPDLIGAAIPFGLKLNDIILVSLPKHAPLLLSTCSNYTGYAYAFVETKADILGEEHHEESKALREEALGLYVRARDLCLRAMDVRFKGISKQLLLNPEAALKKVSKKKEDVPLLYWTAASWGAAISLGLDKPELAADFPAVRALADAAMALDPDWNKGALYELMMSLDSLPPAMGGHPDKVPEHFKRAIDLQKGLSPGPYVSLAAHQAVDKQDREQYTTLLDQALAIDPKADKSNQLLTIITQRRAKAMLAQIDTKIPKIEQ